MTINRKKVTAKYFAYDGCHKIYLLNNDEEIEECSVSGYRMLPIAKLKDAFEKSCSLRFISNWDLDKPDYVKQFQTARFK